MLALVTSRGRERSPAIKAFKEEYGNVEIVFSDENAATAASRLGSRTKQVIALDPDSVALTVELQSRLGADHIIGVSPATLVTGSTEQLNALGKLGRASSSNKTNYSVETVSVDGLHVTCGVFKCRIDNLAGRRLTRHRISIPDRTELSANLENLAKKGLDAIALKNAAACIEIEESDMGIAIVGITASLDHYSVPTDAAFSAFGVSHQHILAESILRPIEFERRVKRPPMRSRTTLAIAPILLLGGATVKGLDGLRILRRLTGYHSLVHLPDIGMELGEFSVAGIACFVHPDRPSVEFSLKVMHEMEDSWVLFSEGQQFIDLSSFIS